MLTLCLTLLRLFQCNQNRKNMPKPPRRGPMSPARQDRILSVFERDIRFLFVIDYKKMLLSCGMTLWVRPPQKTWRIWTCSYILLFYYHNSFCFIFHRFYYFYQLDLFFILALTKLSVLKRNLINLSIWAINLEPTHGIILQRTVSYLTHLDIG